MTLSDIFNDKEVLDAYMPKEDRRKKPEGILRSIPYYVKNIGIGFYNVSREYFFDPILITTTKYVAFGGVYLSLGPLLKGLQLIDTYRGEDDLLKPKKIDGSYFRDLDHPNPIEELKDYRRPV